MTIVLAIQRYIIKGHGMSIERASTNTDLWMIKSGERRLSVDMVWLDPKEPGMDFVIFNQKTRFPLSMARDLAQLYIDNLPSENHE